MLPAIEGTSVRDDAVIFARFKAAAARAEAAAADAQRQRQRGSLRTLTNNAEPGSSNVLKGRIALRRLNRAQQIYQSKLGMIDNVTLLHPCIITANGSMQSLQIQRVRVWWTTRLPFNATKCDGIADNAAGADVIKEGGVTGHAGQQSPFEQLTSQNGMAATHAHATAAASSTVDPRPAARAENGNLKEKIQWLQQHWLPLTKNATQ